MKMKNLIILLIIFLLANFGIELEKLIFLNKSKYPNKKCTYISDNVRIIDGDTIVLDGERIRLQGIDAPELKQTCKNKESKRIWECGKEATEHLKMLMVGKKINCSDEGKDKYRRQLSYCFNEDININQKMVEDGYAVAYTVYDKSFYIDSIIARLKNKGIWSSDFKEPSKWRKEIKNKGRKTT